METPVPKFTQLRLGQVAGHMAPGGILVCPSLPPSPSLPSLMAEGPPQGWTLWGWNHMSSLLSLQALFSTEDSGIQWEDCHVLGRRWA